MNSSLIVDVHSKDLNIISGCLMHSNIYSLQPYCLTSYIMNDFMYLFYDMYIVFSISDVYILSIIVLINGTRICVFTVLGEWGLLGRLETALLPPFAAY